MHQRIAFSLVALASLCACTARAATINIYATTPTAHVANPAPQNSNSSAAPNADSFFDIFVKTDIEIGGLNMDVFLSGGNAAKLTSVIIQNPLNGTNPRWGVDDVFNAQVSADGRSATNAQAATLSSGNRGMNPANSSTDLGYDPLAGAYHFARVNYHTGPLGSTPTTFKFGIGGGDIAVNPGNVSTNVFYGVAPAGQTEAAACNTLNGDCAGSLSTFADGSISVIPEPATMSLVGLGLFGLVGMVRRRK